MSIEIVDRMLRKFLWKFRYDVKSEESMKNSSSELESRKNLDETNSINIRLINKSRLSRNVRQFWLKSAVKREILSKIKEN